MKAFAEDNASEAQMITFVYDRVEKNEKKTENAVSGHFPLSHNILKSVVLCH